MRPYCLTSVKQSSPSAALWYRVQVDMIPLCVGDGPVELVATAVVEVLVVGVPGTPTQSGKQKSKTETTGILPWRN